MLFYLTSDAKIVSKIHNPPRGGECNAVTFAGEQELARILDKWPMQRLVETWNRLPGVRPLRRFEDRKTAIARIWRAVQPGTEQNPRTAQGSSQCSRASRKQVVFREGSKAAHVCELLRRTEGATLTEIISATGWQAHTVRGFVSASLRKQGTSVRTLKRDGEHVYHLKS